MLVRVTSLILILAVTEGLGVGMPLETMSPHRDGMNNLHHT